MNAATVIMNKKQTSYFVLAAILRFLLMYSDYQQNITDRVEVSTALNAWKRITEGIYLHNIGIDPYSGDLFHETPIMLMFFKSAQNFLSTQGLWIMFIIADLLTAFLLGLIAKLYIDELVIRDKKEMDQSLAQSQDKLSIITFASVESVLYVPAAFLFNPYIVLNCVGLTSTVFTNLLFSVALLTMIKRWTVPCILAITLLTAQGLYPISLIMPMSIYVVKNTPSGKRTAEIIKIIVLLLVFLSGMIACSYRIVGSWSFLENTFGFIIMVPDLRPNVGLYWYFFTEMFEHFRLLFIASFQINVGLLYIVPLALRLQNDPMLLSFSYLAIGAIFKSYPCVGDVGFYISLLPMWRHLFRHMQQGFIVGCFMLFCTVFAPTVWHQWIYSRSANANFYFGVTLAFAIAQIFLLTDILFASVKREFALKHGLATHINGKKAKLLLE